VDTPRQEGDHDPCPASPSNLHQQPQAPVARWLRLLTGTCSNENKDCIDKVHINGGGSKVCPGGADSKGLILIVFIFNPKYVRDVGKDGWGWVRA